VAQKLKAIWKNQIMKGRTVGILLSIALSAVGIAGLVWAFITINSTDSSKHLPALFITGLLGTVAFFVGIRLLPGRRMESHVD
jgi:hypothetical protein